MKEIEPQKHCLEYCNIMPLERRGASGMCYIERMYTDEREKPNEKGRTKRVIIICLYIHVFTSYLINLLSSYTLCITVR